MKDKLNIMVKKLLRNLEINDSYSPISLVEDSKIYKMAEVGFLYCEIQKNKSICGEYREAYIETGEKVFLDLMQFYNNKMHKSLYLIQIQEYKLR